jgi:hypothetical protein
MVFSLLHGLDITIRIYISCSNCFCLKRLALFESLERASSTSRCWLYIAIARLAPSARVSSQKPDSARTDYLYLEGLTLTRGTLFEYLTPPGRNASTAPKRAGSF